MARFLGFPYAEQRMLGHWLRDRAAADTPASAPGVRGHGRAVGALDGRGTMAYRYTQGVGRHGERAEQLAVRWKLVSVVREGLAAFGRHWSHLPAGCASWETLLTQPAPDGPMQS